MHISDLARRRLTKRPQPGDLWIAARWVLRTRESYLWSARQFLNDTLIWPLREETINGRRWLIDDTSRHGTSRVLEIAAALVALADAHLDWQVLHALRETPWVDDRDAFAAMAMGMTPAEARTHAEADSFPDRTSMLALAALRGVDLYDIYADAPVTVGL